VWQRNAQLDGEIGPLEQEYSRQPQDSRFTTEGRPQREIGSTKQRGPTRSSTPAQVRRRDRTGEPTLHRTLIIAKIAPEAEQDVASIFAESDQTSLPLIAGVQRRSLYRLGDLYVHLLETSDHGAAAVEAASSHEEFARVSARLRPYISPYLATWQSPRDAQAHCFYEWSREAGIGELG
jgi:cyclase